MASIQYNKIIRKLIVSFGNLFSNIAVGRFDSEGHEQERFILSCNYGGKEEYVQRLQADPDLYKRTRITLPILSFELENIKYDKERKQISTLQNYALTNSGYSSQYVPVPYDFIFKVMIYVRNIEDGHQILEKIIPNFTPDYVMNISLENEMGITRQIPVILNDSDQMLKNEGNSESETRIIIWTLTFTVKAFLYGPIKNAAVIKEAITNVYLDSTQTGDRSLFLVLGSGSGAFTPGETVYQGSSLSLASASANVVGWTANTLRLQIENTTGTFKTNQNVAGTSSHARYNLNNYEITPLKLSMTDVKVNPITANVNDNYTIITTRTYYNP